VNKGTASASEILAGALKDNKRAIVYGEPTYGKGYCSCSLRHWPHFSSVCLLFHFCFLQMYRKIQSVFALSDGSGMAVTVARYETPAHTDIDKVSTAHQTFATEKK
jgi:carboxyl-terminal processing protease